MVTDSKQLGAVLWVKFHKLAAEAPPDLPADSPIYLEMRKLMDAIETMETITGQEKLHVQD